MHAPASATHDVPGALSQPVYSISMNMLKRCPRQSLPLNVQVSATRENGHVLYHCTMTSKVTHTTWTVSHRYSEFFEFKTGVEKRWTCGRLKCGGSCQAIRDYMESSFPPKRLLGSASQRTIDERKAKLENVLLHLLRSVLFTGSAMGCVVARTRLPKNLLQLLGVSNMRDCRSVLQIFVDNYQDVVKHQIRISCTNSEESTSARSSEAQQCAFCMEDLESDCCWIDSTNSCAGSFCSAGSSPEMLPCKHTFHCECEFEWLMFEFHCPVCRSQVGPPAVTSVCRPTGRTQWWVGDYEQDSIKALLSKDFCYHARQL